MRWPHFVPGFKESPWFFIGGAGGGTCIGAGIGFVQTDSGFMLAVGWVLVPAGFAVFILGISKGVTWEPRRPRRLRRHGPPSHKY